MITIDIKIKLSKKINRFNSKNKKILTFQSLKTLRKEDKTQIPSYLTMINKMKNSIKAPIENLSLIQ